MRPPPVALPPSAPNLLGHWVLMLLSGLAVALAIGAYFAGPGATFPESLPAQLLPVPLTLETFSVGDLAVPVPVSGFIVSLTHDVGGPLVHPVAAGTLLFFLAVAVTGWLAVVSTLARAPFAVGMVPVVFLLMSLQAEALGVFAVGEQYFFYLLLVVLGGTALHSFLFLASFSRPSLYFPVVFLIYSKLNILLIVSLKISFKLMSSLSFFL